VVLTSDEGLKRVCRRGVLSRLWEGREGGGRACGCTCEFAWCVVTVQDVETPRGSSLVTLKGGGSGCGLTLLALQPTAVAHS
jgi:hypothetical protein